MKTTIIQLEEYDNLISIKDRIGWSKTQRVLIIWPNTGQIRLQLMEIILILRAAEEIGTQLSVVTDDPVVRRQMRDLGVSTFASIPEAQKRPWRKPKFIKRSIMKMGKDRKPFNLDNSRKSEESLKKIPSFMRWLLFILSVLSFSLVILFFVPSGKVSIIPEEENQEIIMNFRSDQSIKQANITGAIPASLVKIEIEGQLDGESSGIIRIPDKNASGKVTFRNLSDKDVTIPVGTIVRTTNEPIIRFRTTTLAKLEPGIESMIDVPVICLQGGTIGNIPSGGINAIENDMGGNMNVTNDLAMAGGVDIKTFSPSEGDYLRLKNELLLSIHEKVEDEIRNTYPQILLIPKDSIILEEIISEVRMPEVGNPAERLVLRIKAKYSALVINKDDVENSIDLALNANLPSQFEPVIDSENFEIIDNSIKFSNNSIEWNGIASRRIIPKIDQQELIRKILGKTKSQASNIVMNEFSLEREPIIETFPTFLNILPFLPFQITLEINE